MTGTERTTEVVYPFTAEIYLRDGSVKTLYSSNVLWRMAEDKLREIEGFVENCSDAGSSDVQCIYNLPNDFLTKLENKGLFTVETCENSDDNNNRITQALYLKGLTSDLNYESMRSFSLPPVQLEKTESLVLLQNLLREHSSDQKKNDGKTLGQQQQQLPTERKYLQLLDTLSKTYNVEVLITQSGSLEVSFGIIGTSSHITACKHEFVAIIELIQYEIASSTDRRVEVEIDTLDIDAYSLLPCFLDSRVIDFYKRYLLTTIHPPNFYCHGGNCGDSNDSSSDRNNNSLSPPLLPPTRIFLVGGIQSLLQGSLNEIKKSIFYRSVAGLSPGKVQFLKRFRSEEIAALAIEHQCFIWLKETSIEFQTFSVQLLNQTIKQFTLTFLQDIAELTVFTHGAEATENLVKGIVDQDQCNKERKKIFDSEYMLIRSSVVPDRVVICTTYASLVKETNFHPNIFTTNQASIVQYRVNFEVNQEYEDFICGKKNGKLTRVIDNVDTVVELFSNGNYGNHGNQGDHGETLGDKVDDTTVTISLVSNQFNDFKTSMANLIEELPAEYSFFIPEVYHRPIIGSGGAVIQTIMRKHNVFIQFSNSFTMPQNKLAMLRYDNVVIRCPNKNSQNIELARDELLKLVEEFNYVNISKKLELSSNKFKNIIMGRSSAVLGGGNNNSSNNGNNNNGNTNNTTNSISISSNNSGNGNGGNGIGSTVSNLSKIVRLERKYNVFINFPLKMPPLDSVQPVETYTMEISGHESNGISQAVNEIVNDGSLWPQEIRLRMSSNFKNFLQDEEKLVKFYNEVIVPLEQIFPQLWLSYNIPNSDIQIALAENHNNSHGHNRNAHSNTNNNNNNNNNNSDSNNNNNNSQAMRNNRDTQNKIISFITTYLNERGIALIEKTGF